MPSTQYIHNPHVTIRAVRFLRSDVEQSLRRIQDQEPSDIEEWCRGQIIGRSMQSPMLRVNDHKGIDVFAEVGDWVVSYVYEDGAEPVFDVLTNEQFTLRFKLKE